METSAIIASPPLTYTDITQLYTHTQRKWTILLVFHQLPTFQSLSEKLTDTYDIVHAALPIRSIHLDLIVIPVLYQDLIGQLQRIAPERIYNVGEILCKTKIDTIQIESQSEIKMDSIEYAETSWIDEFQYGVLGGTFDHLHGGHKVLLTMAALLCSDTLAIGVTGDQMLTRKQYADLLEPWNVRVRGVQSFLELVKPTLNADCELLQDAHGCALRPENQVLIASEETRRGAQSTLDKRIEFGLDAAELRIVGLVQGNTNETMKMSSTWIRQFHWLRRIWLQEELPERWYNTIAERYCEKQRAYHSMDHIAYMFKILNQLSDQVDFPKVVSLSIWFHDVVYDPIAKDNEIKSAELFQEFAKDTGMNTDVDIVKSFILATIKHEIPDDIPAIYVQDLERFLDLDLSILGADSKTYTKYTEQIRYEYGHLSDEEFASGRCAAMEHFLRRSRLYFSQTFQDLLEDIARSNVSKEIDSLRKSLL